MKKIMLEVSILGASEKISLIPWSLFQRIISMLIPAIRREGGAVARCFCTVLSLRKLRQALRAPHANPRLVKLLKLGRTRKKI